MASDRTDKLMGFEALGLLTGTRRAGDWSGMPELTGLSVDSRETRPGHLFAALPGSRAHGAEFVPVALRMGAPFLVERGIDPSEEGLGPALVMPFVIGLKRARELLFFGDPIDAQTALQYGMVNRVVPRAELAPATLKFARRMSLISPEALNGTKLAINRGAESAGFRNAINAGLDILAAVYAARTEVGMKFDEIREKEGLGAALRWRASQFTD